MTNFKGAPIIPEYFHLMSQDMSYKHKMGENQ